MVLINVMSVLFVSRHHSHYLTRVLLWKVAEEVLAMTISLTPAQILDLAKQINRTIQSLTNIDAILDATRDDLHTVNDLKRRADDAKSASNLLRIDCLF